MDFFNVTDADREEKRRNRWLKTQAAKAWQQHLSDQWRGPQEQAMAVVDRVAQGLLAEAPRWPWSTPTYEQKAVWGRTLMTIVGAMIRQPGNPAYLSNTGDTIRLYLVSADKSSTRRCAGTLVLGKHSIPLWEDQVQLLLDERARAITLREAEHEKHFAQPMPKMFEESQRSTLIAQWERDPTLNQALQEQEDLEREMSRNARRAPANPSTSGDDDRRSDNGGWNALGTSYIGGSGNPYDSWSP